mmetsp:Transcript_3545/g.12733  ORF Transcript_3545/g.12733 Transcript_3545/m.12733 type:complete len:217 (-) Transcript_3545:591-1241(-)
MRVSTLWKEAFASISSTVEILVEPGLDCGGGEGSGVEGWRGRGTRAAEEEERREAEHGLGDGGRPARVVQAVHLEDGRRRLLLLRDELEHRRRALAEAAPRALEEHERAETRAGAVARLHERAPELAAREHAESLACESPRAPARERPPRLRLRLGPHHLRAGRSLRVEVPLGEAQEARGGDGLRRGHHRRREQGRAVRGSGVRSFGTAAQNDRSR